MNLITTFIEATTADGSLADALRQMNAALNVNVTNSRIREWERGDGRRPSPEAMNYMLAIALPYLLLRAKLSKKLADEIALKCLLP